MDPSRNQYRELGNLLNDIGCRDPVPLIEIHRVCYEGSGRARRILDLADLELGFRQALAEQLDRAGLEVEVFVSDDFHDRHLLSNLIGISLPNGFDTSNAVNNVTTWTRLGRQEHDDIQREFEEASGRHVLRRRFHSPVILVCGCAERSTVFL